MDAVTTHQTAREEPRGPNGRSPRHDRLAAGGHYPLSREVFEQLLRDYLEAQGVRIRRDRIDRGWRAYEEICKRWAFVEDSMTFRLTHAQGAKAIDSKQNMAKSSDCKTLMRALDDHEALGLLVWGGVKYPSGRWRCLEITMLPTVGEEAAERLRERPITWRSSTRRRRREACERPAKPPARSARSFFLTSEVSGPFGAGESPLKGGLSPAEVSRTSPGARARGPTAARRSPNVGTLGKLALAPLTAGLTPGAGEPGAKPGLEPPEAGDRAGAERWRRALRGALAAGNRPREALEAAWEALFATDPRLSSRIMAPRLERAIEGLDRYRPPDQAPAVEQAFERLLGLHDDVQRGSRGREPYSLAWLVPWLERRWREERRRAGRTKAERRRNRELRQAGEGTQKATGGARERRPSHDSRRPS